jgi:hypothetical protein
VLSIAECSVKLSGNIPNYLTFVVKKCSQIIDNFDGPQSVFPFMEIALLYPCKIAKNSW